MAIVFVGVDLAKNVFAVHGVGQAGRAELVRPKVPRAKLLGLIAELAPCTIGMEACSGAHHWAREFQRLGHSVRLMAPKFVTPYRLSGKRGKNDAADAAAICEAVQRPNMRFVPAACCRAGLLLALRRRVPIPVRPRASCHGSRPRGGPCCPAPTKDRRDRPRTDAAACRQWP